jgi:hypothetical protein
VYKFFQQRQLLLRQFFSFSFTLFLFISPQLFKHTKMDGQVGATAQSKEFGKREKAAEDQWARQKVTRMPLLLAFFFLIE